jgi:hypothetical protein
MKENTAMNAPILNVPTAELPVIEELVEFMHVMQFRNLRDLLEFKVSDLLKMHGFGYRCLRSLYQVLEANGCEELLKE